MPCTSNSNDKNTRGIWMMNATHYLHFSNHNGNKMWFKVVRTNGGGGVNYAVESRLALCLNVSHHHLQHLLLTKMHFYSKQRWQYSKCKWNLSMFDVHWVRVVYVTINHSENKRLVLYVKIIISVIISNLISVDR